MEDFQRKVEEVDEDENGMMWRKRLSDRLVRRGFLISSDHLGRLVTCPSGIRLRKYSCRELYMEKNMVEICGNEGIAPYSCCDNSWIITRDVIGEYFCWEDWRYDGEMVGLRWEIYVMHTCIYGDQS